MGAIIEFLVKRGLVVNLVSIFLLAVGLYAALNINREAFPNVNLDLIQIDTVYPGASPREVEQLIVIPIEQELKSLSGIDKMVSMSFPGSGRITLEVDPNASNRDQLANDVAMVVSRAKMPSDLPNDPFVTEVDGSVFPIIRLAITAPLDELALKRLGDDIKDDLLAIKGIARAQILGARKAEIRIVVDPERMARERISVGEVARVLKNWNLNVPGGDINTATGQKVVRVVGEFKNAEDAKTLVLRANARGDVLTLGDIADVTDALDKPATYYDVKGEPALSMLVLKKSDADIIDTVDKLKVYLDTVKQRYGESVEVKTFQDFSRFARLRLGVLTNNGLFGLALVFISLLLFLRFSVAMTTTWGLPIIFLSGLYLLFVSGVTLNLISMMGFIMVLGMLVDDAIIIGENITWHMEQGLNRMDAAVLGAKELIGPVTATILTTVAAFLPMMFMTGVIGKFIIGIPIVVITLLILSWLESFLILPSHVAHVTHPDKHPSERRWLVLLDKTYAWFLGLALRFRWSTVTLSFAVLLAALMLAKTMPFQLFPAAGVDEFVVRLSAPPGTSLEKMRENLRAVDHKMRQQINPEYLEATLLKSGDVSVDQGDPLTQRGSRYGQIRAIYMPAVTRPDHDVLADLKVLAGNIPEQFPDLDITFSEVKPGPPVGRAIEAEISSFDDKASEDAAHHLMAYLRTIDGVKSVDSGLKQGDDELRVILDRQRAIYAGIDLVTASQHIRAATGGLVVSSLRQGIEEVDVTIRFPDKNEDMAQLEQLLIPNQSGGLIPLYKIASFEEHQGFTTIRHKDGTRIVNVVADVNAGVITSSALNNLVRETQSEWLGGLEDRVTVGYGGEEEKNKESFVSLVVSFVFALVAIYFILAIQFNSLGYPFVVMLAIPFGGIGIIISFYLHDLYWHPMPLSFFSMLGMVALTGVVVNSSLVLLAFIQRAIQSGIEPHEAILQAGRRRLRAVLLTATTTVLGLLPTAYGWGGMDPFVAPMALALSWGLMFATVVTLFTIPAALAVGLDIKGFFKRLLGRKEAQV